MSDDDNLVEAIDKLLPQTQCQECDFSACRPYAEAIASGQANIDRCKPGGAEVLHALAAIRSIDPKPYLQTVMDQFRPATTVRIDLDTCIGCVKCIKACPVDAIIGAPKQAHVVLQDVCTGCNLCIEPCPVDCIEIVPNVHRHVQDRGLAVESRQRYRKKQRREEQVQQKKDADFVEVQNLIVRELV